MSKSLKVLNIEVIKLKHQNHLLIDKYDREIENLKCLIKQSIRNHSKKKNIQLSQQEITNANNNYQIIQTVNTKIDHSELKNNLIYNFQKIDQEIQNITIRNI